MILLIFNCLDLYHVLIIVHFACSYIHLFKYYFRLTVREGCVDILFYLKILSVLDKSDARRQHTK